MAPLPNDRQTFLARVRQSGLVAEARLAEVAGELAEINRSRPLARALVERGLLTKFQAERLLVGRTTGFHLGQYRILDQLGRGGMGRVFKALHLTMGRIVALKVLAPDVLQDDRARELFRREMWAVSKLVHPHIVTAFDANEIDGRCFLVLEYVDGPNLDQLVRRQGPLLVGLACDYTRQVADGLQCAHVLGMVHRDIKPANILVQRRGLDENSPGLVKISDFGLARLHAPDADVPHSPGTILTKENTVMGTPDFLSPEQARCLHKTDIRSDLYSLGCTFYYLLTGEVPFPGGSTLDKMIRHTTETPASVAARRPEVPAAVAAIVARLLAKHPAERYQTPAELSVALQPFAVSGPTPWAPSKPPSDVDFGPDGSDETSALVNTVSPDRSPTTGDPRPRSDRADQMRRWWRSQDWRIPLLTALAIVCTVLMGFFLFILLGGK
jgi:serine/threonine-protein kinase